MRSAKFKSLLISLLIMATCSADSWGQSFGSQGLEEYQLPLFPWFLGKHKSGWNTLGMDLSNSLESAHKEFQEGILTRRFHKAIQAFLDELARSEEPPWESEALWHVAEAYHRMRHFQEASAYWSRLLRKVPQGSLARAARAALAESLFQSRELEQALELCRVLIQELEGKRDISWALFRCGDSLYHLGEHKEATLWYQRALKLNPPLDSMPPESLENMARIALDRADAKEASWMSMTALGLYPEHPRARSWTLILARAMKLQNKFFQSSLLLNKLLDTEQKSREREIAGLILMSAASPCIGHPGLFRLSLGLEDPESIKKLIFNQEPGDRDLQLALGDLVECWSGSGRSLEAWEILESFNRGLQEDYIWPELRKALWKTGTTLVAQAMEMGRVEVAMEAFHWMAERIPGVRNDPALLLKAARLHERLGFFSTAADLYTRVRVLVGPGTKAQEAAMGLIRCHLGVGRLEEAFRVLRQEPSWGSSKATEAAILEWAGKISSPRGFQVAARFLEEVSSGMPTPESCKSLGLLSLEMKLCAPAVQLLKPVVESMEGHQSVSLAEVQVLMGDLLSCAGKEKEALRWYEKVAGRPQWADTEKWAALRILQLRAADESQENSLPYLERLTKEPPGSPWRVLVEDLKQRQSLGTSSSRKGAS